MSIPVICTFPGNPGLSEVLPVLAPSWLKHWWAWVTLSQEAQEKSCPAQSQGMVLPFPHSLHNRDTLGEFSSSPTPSAAFRPSSALCWWENRGNTRSTGSCWTIQRSILWMDMTNSSLSVSLFLNQYTAQPLPRWQPSLCHDCQRRVHDDTAYIPKNKVLCLLVTPAKPNLLVISFHCWK